VGEGNSCFYPHVSCEKCGIVTVRWGRGGRAFLGALILLLGTSGTMTTKVIAGESARETSRENTRKLARNVGKLDERQRVSEARQKLVAEQMQLLLDAAQVTEHPVMPDVEESTLETLE